MTLRADSYSSKTSVLALTRHLLNGQLTFNSTTSPTATELDDFINRASACLNLALAGGGLHTPITNSTGKLLCDDWVTIKAAEYAELTQRGVGYSEQEGSRVAYMAGMYGKATEFVAESLPGLLAIGVTRGSSKGSALLFTGQVAQEDRPDPDDDTLAQPLFVNRQFDNEGGT